LIRLQATWFSRTNAVAFARRFSLMMFAAVALTAPGLGGDQKPDKTVTRGEVFCAWSIYFPAQVRTAKCGLPRQPMDDAIDEAVTQIEEFILANFSNEITRPMLEDIKRIVKESPMHDPARNKELCTDEAGYEKGDKRPTGFAELIRSGDPDRLRKETRELLSRPLGPPRPAPCL
jgi:hypothetical protein